MRPIIEAFYREPVVVLACLAVSVPILVSEAVIGGIVGAVAIAVIGVLQRHFVRPDRAR